MASFLLTGLRGEKGRTVLSRYFKGESGLHGEWEFFKDLGDFYVERW